MSEHNRLNGGATWAPRRKAVTTARLSDVLSELMESQISPRQERFAAVAELWIRLLPSELRRHCRLDGVSGGELKVLVDSPSYLHELRMCSEEILGQLQQQCPKARIKKINCSIG